jgi:hypothetical protein
MKNKIKEEKEFLKKLKCICIIKDGDIERFGCMNCGRIYTEINRRLKEMKK